MIKQNRLQMIQGIINRLAGNSSTFKGWMVTIASALLGLAINNKKEYLGWLGVYAVCVLGVLDASYLSLEKSYRTLYNRVAALSEDDTDWSLTADRVGIADVVSALLSPSVWLFYVSAIVAGVVVALSV